MDKLAAPSLQRPTSPVHQPRSPTNLPQRRTLASRSNTSVAHHHRTLHKIHQFRKLHLDTAVLQFSHLVQPLRAAKKLLRQLSRLPGMQRKWRWLPDIGLTKVIPRPWPSRRDAKLEKSTLSATASSSSTNKSKSFNCLSFTLPSDGSYSDDYELQWVSTDFGDWRN